MTTYEATDASVAESRPKLLFDFADDFGTHWRYNTGTDTVSFLGFDYTADRSSMSELELSGNPFRNEVEIRLSRGNVFAIQFISGPLESKVAITVYRQLENDDSGGPPFALYWFGLVQTVAFDDDSRPKLQCVPRTSSVARVGRRRTAQIMCDVGLYSQEIGECLLDKELFKITGIITSIDGLSLTSPDFDSQPDDWLKGGELVIGNAHRLIKSHINSSGSGTIEIYRAINNPETDSGDNIVFTAFAGCDHLASTCAAKFANRINYAGQEYLPVKNPFSGDAIIE